MKKQFKAESKKLLEMMINSIYTNQEIFLRELVSNASDALDKLYYRSLTDKKVKIKKKDLEITIIPDKEKRTLTICDNGIGMTKEELENNLGTIAKSGSSLFKESMSDKKNIEIIGQFGVGFYSSFMISDKVMVISKSVDSKDGYLWESEGASGYSVKDYDKKDFGTEVILYLKEDTEDNKYSDFLEENTLSRLIKKYSDYISYPIKIKDYQDNETINSMIPIWKKNKKDVKIDEYNSFYIDKFYDYENPLEVIKSSVEGRCSYQALLFIPSHAPYDYYSKEYEKGLQLYSKGVLIMDKCSDLLPDYYSFVKGVVDSEDISLNISRETLQENYQIKDIAKSIENKITKELTSMLKNKREDYEKFYQAFGMQLKYGIYASYGMKKDLLEALLLFYSSKEDKYVTLAEYKERMLEGQKYIYYITSDSINKAKTLPQTEEVVEKGYEVLYLTDYMDEFTVKAMMKYQDFEFMSLKDEKMDITSDEEKKETEEVNTNFKDLLEKIKDNLSSNVKEVAFTNTLKTHPVCLKNKGEVSVEMEKVLDAIPNNQNIKAETVLLINNNHEIANKLRKLYEDKDFETIEKYSKILYQEARIIEGLDVENPTELSSLVCELLAK